ncbi:hypothetical protein BX257_7590 [Streptomyces sp. 3212.3]|nr:hypothetical protein BX257_7590 [Streptomyces sp. 3212.3]
MRGIWTRAPRSSARGASAASAVSIASYRTGTVPRPRLRIPRCPIRLATHTSVSTRTTWTAPRPKSFVSRARYQARYAASGSGQRSETAVTKPRPQRPTSLHTWATTFAPSPDGMVASPRTYRISDMTPP